MVTKKGLTMKKFMRIVGGKRGLGIIIGTAAAVISPFGIVPATVITGMGVVAAALGFTGIVHSNVKTK